MTFLKMGNIIDWCLFGVSTSLLLLLCHYYYYCHCRFCLMFVAFDSCIQNIWKTVSRHHRGCNIFQLQRLRSVILKQSSYYYTVLSNENLHQTSLLDLSCNYLISGYSRSHVRRCRTTPVWHKQWDLVFCLCSSLSCMDPSIAIKPVFQRFQSVIITSGVSWLRHLHLFSRVCLISLKETSQAVCAEWCTAKLIS